MSPDEYDIAAGFIETVQMDDYDWSVTLTARSVALSAVKDSFDEWISQIEEQDGATKWCRVTECGGEYSFSFHVFIGGRHNTHRYKWMCLWAELTGGEARSRYRGETERLRGLLRYFVLKRNFGFKVRDSWGSNFDIKGWNE